MVIAKTKSQTREKLRETSLRLDKEWRWGVNQFATARKMLPKIIPREATQSPPSLMDGRTKLKEVAPSMIPAEKPRSPSIIFRGTFLRKKIGIAPNPVANPAPTLASQPAQTTSPCMSKTLF
jgi:hypothetical protein